MPLEKTEDRAALHGAAAILAYVERERDPGRRRLKLAADVARFADELPDGDERAERLRNLAYALAQVVERRDEAALVLDEIGELVTGDSAQGLYSA